MSKARYQHQHGTSTQLWSAGSTILDDEIAIVDSGAQNKSGSAVHFKPLGANKTIELANREDTISVTFGYTDKPSTGYETLSSDAYKQGDFFYNTSDNKMWVCSERVATVNNTYKYKWKAIATGEDISDKVDNTTTIAGIDLQDDITASELSEALETFEKHVKVVEVLDAALDTAFDIKTLYLHRVTSGSSSYIKGAVICTGSGLGYTQVRFRRSGGVEYRTGYGNPFSWGEYTANGDWIKLATVGEIPDITDGWKNKTYISHGDSITWQDGREYSGTETVARGYQTVLKEQLSLGTHTNKGADAYTMALRNNIGGVNVVKSVSSYTSYGICTIAYGTNDFRWSIPLGTLGAIGDSNFDLTTFYGAYRESIEYILTSAPEIQLVLMTPLQRNRSGYDVNTVNGAGLKLIDYANAVKQLGQLYGVPVCDMYSTSGFTQLTLPTYARDGLHPNDLGYDRMGKLLARFMKSGF